MARLLVKVGVVVGVGEEAFEEGPSFAEVDGSSLLLAQYCCVDCSHDGPYGLVKVDDFVELVMVMNLMSLLDEAATSVLVRSLSRYLPCEATHLPLKSGALGSSLPALMPPLWPWQRLAPETRRILDAYSLGLQHMIVSN